MRFMAKEKNFVVAHSVVSWLPLTMGWIYNQLKYIDMVDSVVFTLDAQNPDVYPWEPIVLPRHVGFKPLHWAFLFLRRMGWRWYTRVYNTAVRTHRPAILHSHFGNMGWINLPLARKHQLKHVVTFYGYDLSMLPVSQPRWKQRYQELFAEADLFFCEGPHMAQSLTAWGCPPDKICVQRLGIEVDKIYYAPRKIETDGKIKILMVGSFREKKGFPIALEAVAKVYAQYPGLQVTIIGDAGPQAREKQEKEKILEVIERHKLQPIVKMMGYQPHRVMLEEAYKHHIFLSPSVTASNGDTEGGAPVTIIEMSASGMPIVSTMHCDIPYVVENEESGILVPERDVAALAVALQRLISNPSLIAIMGLKGHEYINVRHNARVQAAQIRKYYESLL